MKPKSKSRTEMLRRILSSKRERLRSEISRDLDKGLTYDRMLEVDQVIESADQAVRGVSKDIEIEVLEIKNRTLRAIDGALERLERGRYGLCEECGDEIEGARLEAVPFALYCFSCQKQLEKEEKTRRSMQSQFWGSSENLSLPMSEEE